MATLPIFHYFEWAAFLASLGFYKNIHCKPLKWLPIFLLIVVIVETVGRYMHYVIGKSNAWLYNLYTPIEIFFYTYLFYEYLQHKVFKLITKYLLILLPIIALVNLFFVQGFYELNSNFIKISSIAGIFLCGLYFIDIFISPETIYPLREPLFWIATGFLFYNLGGISYYLFIDYIMANKKDPNGSLFRSINTVVICLLYSCLIIAVYIDKKYATPV
jgi:hypothetical protein